MKKIIIILMIFNVSLYAMEKSSYSKYSQSEQKRSSYRADTFELTKSSNEAFAQEICTPKQEKKRKKDKFKFLCKKYMFYQLVTHQNLRELTHTQFKSLYTTLDLSILEITDLKDFLKKAVLAFELSRKEKPKRSFLKKHFSVHIIDLSDNQLVSLPKGFKELAQCAQSVDLSNNKLKEVPPQLEFCKNMRELNIENNEIARLPEWVNASPSLKSIIVGGNKALFVPKDAKIEKDKKRGSIRVIPSGD